MRIYIPCIVFVILGFCSCRHERPSNYKAPVLDEVRTGGIVDEIRAAFPIGTNSWKIQFRSRNGEAFCQDSDTSITFSADGNVTLSESGYTAELYHGKTQVANDGSLNLLLPEYESQWPAMILREESGEFFLFRKDGQRNFQFGDRAGASESTDMPEFWPLRLTRVSIPVDHGSPKDPNEARREPANEIFKAMLTKLSELSENWTVEFGCRQDNEYTGSFSIGIEFHWNGSVTIVEWVDSELAKYAGKAQMDPDGTIHMLLSGYGPDWPDMIIRNASGSYYIMRKDGSGLFDRSARGARSKEYAEVWPFHLTGIEWSTNEPH